MELLSGQLSQTPAGSDKTNVSLTKKYYTERVWLVRQVFGSVGRVLKKAQRKIIGDALLKHRRRAGFSQEALAEKADIHPNYVGRIERGECAATLEILCKLARALNVRVYKLFLKL